jgi:Tfp pilus assembly protein PilF
VEIFEQGVALYPDSHEMLNYLAYTWAVAGTNLDTALAYANRALAHEPDNGAYLDTLGWILFRQNRPADALAQIRRALDRLKDDPTITDHAGDICEAMADRAGAVSFWTRSLSLDPDNEAVADKLRARGADIEAIRRQAQSAGAGANTE